MVAPAAPGGRADSLETLYVDIAARADQLVSQADAAVRLVIQRLDLLEAKNRELEQSYSRLGGFIKNALSTATGFILAQVGFRLTTSVLGFGRALIQTNAQMQMYTRSFETLTGSAAEAGEIIEWVKDQAKATPFDVPGLISASQQLMTWGLDLQEWFTIVGDTAAAMNRPLRQVVNAIGTLATGQTGEAIRRFRDLGINLREFTDVLKFDARGSLITPLEEAIPVIRQIMIDKFGGMMESQSRTWAGVMSNMRDTWQQVVQVMGEPVFETLNQNLFEMFTWMEENSESIENFAQNFGAFLGGALDIMMDLLSTVGEFLLLIDEALARLVGTPDWVERGVRAGRELAAILASIPGRAAITGAGVFETALGVPSEEVQRRWEARSERMREMMMSIAGVSEEAEESILSVEEAAARLAETLTDAQLKGIEAVRALSDAYTDLSDAEVFAVATAAEIAEPLFKGAEAAGALLAPLEGMAKAAADLVGPLLEDNEALQALSPALQFLGSILGPLVAKGEELVDTSREIASTYRETVTAAEQAAAALEQVRLQQEASLLLAQEVAAKLTERLQEAMNRYQEAVEAAQAATAEAIAKIEAEAAQAEDAAIVQSQAAVALLRAEFAREQLRRRRQFNLEWARLIRDQNQEVIDAEWEYQFAKENLLIEGDEIALAELEARYEHEQVVRDREQGDARSDMQERYDEESRYRQEQFELQLRQLELRLEKEIENIRREAKEEVDAKKAALDERLEDEDEKLRDRLEKIGEMLADEVGDNQYATYLILLAWTEMYGEQVAQAIRTGVAVRQEMYAIIAAAQAAAAAVASIPYIPVKGEPRHTGGYTPSTEMSILSLPGEFVLDRATTSELEQIAGRPLTQHTVRSLAESRRVLDVNINAVGVGADTVEQMYRDLLDALTEEGGEF